MKTRNILAIAIASLVSTSAFAASQSGVGQSSATDLAITFGIGSAAASAGASGSSVSGVANRCANVSASQTSLATGTSLSSTTIGLGLTGGLTGAVGSDKTGDHSDFTQSAGLTGGLGDAFGITSTSIAGHTDNTGSTGEADVNGNGTADFAGAAYSESAAAVNNYLTVDYTLSDKSWKVEKPKKEHHDNGHHYGQDK